MNSCKKFVAALSGIVCGFIFSIGNASTATSPVGYWKTIDHVTGKPKSIVKIWKTKDQLLMGKVIKIFPTQGKSTASLCTECSGANRNQPIVGMLIVSGLYAYKQRWDNGKILDPENGKTYTCAMRISENGKKLNVQGYIGLPLFGRSQTWERVDLMSG
jgi:uncharacterized protein (DUF2147 family)